MIDFQWLAREMGCGPFNDEEKEILQEALIDSFAPPGMPIIHQGREGNAIYLLRSGRVKVVRRNEAGKRMELSAHSDLRVFGEMSFFSEERASANVEAEEYCTIYELTRERFETLMRKSPELAMKLMTMVVRNMGNTIRRMDSKFARIY